MAASQIYILIFLVALLIIFLLVFVVKKKKREKISLLVGFAFAFIISSMFFEDRLISYILIGIGVLLAVADIFVKSKKRKK